MTRDPRAVCNMQQQTLMLDPHKHKANLLAEEAIKTDNRRLILDLAQSLAEAGFAVVRHMRCMHAGLAKILGDVVAARWREEGNTAAPLLESLDEPARPHSRSTRACLGPDWREEENRPTPQHADEHELLDQAALCSQTPTKSHLDAAVLPGRSSDHAAENGNSAHWV